MTTKTKTLITSLAVCGGILLGAGTAEADATYTVKSGDTLSNIAERTGQSVSDLAQKNGISDINHLSVGQVIEIADTSENGTYTVKSGDTLSGIAEKYGTTVDRLMQLNHLSSDFLVVGEQIVTGGSQEPAQTVQTQPQSTTTNSAQVAQNSSQTYTQAQNSQMFSLQISKLPRITIHRYPKANRRPRNGLPNGNHTVHIQLATVST